MVDISPSLRHMAGVMSGLWLPYQANSTVLYRPLSNFGCTGSQSK